MIGPTVGLSQVYTNLNCQLRGVVSIVVERRCCFLGFVKGSGYIYVTVTFFKSRVSFFNIFRVAKKFINFIINP